MYESGKKANDLAAKAQLVQAKAEADAAKKSISTFDNSANDRQLAQAKSAIYGTVGHYADPNIQRQMKLDQTAAYNKALDNYLTNTSANLGAYNKEVKETTDYNRGVESKFAGQALATGFNKKAADEKLAAAKTTADMTSIDNMVRGLTGVLTAAKNEATQMNNARTLAEGQINWNNTLVNRWNELRARGAIDDETAYNHQDDIESYLKAYDSKWYGNNHNLYQSEVASRIQSTNLFAPAFTQYGTLPMMQSVTRITKPTTEVVQRRRGGRLPVEDILWIEKNKNAAKTIARLHEDVLKLLKVGK